MRSRLQQAGLVFTGLCAGVLISLNFSANADKSPLAPLPVTFDRATWDESDDADLVFLTYGTPELSALLPAASHDD